MDDLTGKNKKYDNFFFNLSFVFCLLFSGDYLFYGIRIYFIFLFIYLVLSIWRRQLKKIQIVLCVALLILFGDILIRESFKSDQSHKIIMLISSPLWLDAFIKLIKSNLSAIQIKILQLFTLSLSIYSIYLLSKSTVRGSLIFGPNVLYRIYFFFSAISIYHVSRKYRKKKYTNIERFKGFLLIISTGSRASLGLIPFLFKIRKKLILLYGFIFGLLLIAIRVLNPRMLNFTGIEGSFRYVTYLKILDLKNYMTIPEILFGATSNNNVYSFYPHNILLETIVEFGLFRTGILILLNVILIRKIDLYFKFIYPLLGIYIGSIFSGSYFENFIVFTVPLYLLTEKQL